MKCVLMNKNIEVLKVEYNEISKFFDQILEVINIDYAPLQIKNVYNETNLDEVKILLSKWFRGRGIPSWRDKLDLLLARLDINTPEELLDKAFGLSLSDQYWLKPLNTNIKYEDINFFDHVFDYSEFLEASFSSISNKKIKEDSLKTPNNTTDGMLKKAWIIKNNRRYLLKGGYKNEILQPFNEVLATRICERLEFDHVPYRIEVINNKVFSSCECFINKNTEFITASQILQGKEKHKSKQDYLDYVELLIKNGIPDAREKLENMYILDFLLMNEDRHLNNFGIIRDVNNLKWLDVAPIFDNGQSLNVVAYDNSELIISGEGRFFYNIDKFDNIIKIVENIKRIDVSSLDGIVEEFDELLHKYQKITGISNEKIHKLCILLNRQIEKLKDIIEAD